MEGGCDAGADGSRVPAKISRDTRRSGAKIAQDLYDSGNGRRLPPSPFRLSLSILYIPPATMCGRDRVTWCGCRPTRYFAPPLASAPLSFLFSSLRVLFVDFVVQLTSGIYYLF